MENKLISIEQPALLDRDSPQTSQRQSLAINLSVDSRDELTQSFGDPEEPKKLGLLKPEEEEPEPSKLTRIAE